MVQPNLFPFKINSSYYAKWNKSDREREILYDTTYVWNIKHKTN